MWWREYEDYPVDGTLKREKVEPGKGIVGCEMHDRNGWGETFHRRPKRRPGLFLTLVSFLFGTKLTEAE